MLRIAEVANRHKVPLRYHPGIPMGYTAAYSYGFLGPANSNPRWGHDIAAAFPDLVLIFDHGGIQAWWWERWYEECLNVVGAHDNVYVEHWIVVARALQKPLVDPNIGPEKLLWGTDWGASMQIYSQLGRTPPRYPVQLRKEGIVNYQVDYWEWSLREPTSLRLSEDDMNLILLVRVVGRVREHRRRVHHLEQVLYRHRIRCQVRRRGREAEVIDDVLGRPALDPRYLAPHTLPVLVEAPQSGGSHAKPHSATTTRRSGKRSNTPSLTKLSTCAWTIGWFPT
jgi:Amidohydrolase